MIAVVTGDRIEPWFAILASAALLIVWLRMRAVQRRGGRS